MITIATAFMWTGFVVGVMGILSGLILVYRALRDWWDERRQSRQSSARIREIRGESKYTFNRHRLTP